MDSINDYSSDLLERGELYTPPVPDLHLTERVWEQLEALTRADHQHGVLSDAEVAVLTAAVKADRAAACGLLPAGLLGPAGSAVGSGALLYCSRFISDSVGYWTTVSAAAVTLLAGVASNYIGTGVLPHKSSDTGNARQDLLTKLKKRFVNLSVSLIRGGVTDAQRCIDLARRIDPATIEADLIASGVPDGDAADIASNLSQAKAWIVDVKTPDSWEIFQAADRFLFARPLERMDL